MNGVTTAVIGFIFFALAFPTLIKNKTQYYLALAAILFVILLDASGHVVRAEGYDAFVYFIAALLQIAAVVLLVLAAGGLTLRELSGEISDAIEVVRRGESEKEIIIPLSDETKRKMAAKMAADAEARRASIPTPEPTVYRIDDPSVAPAAPKPVAPPRNDSGPLPLE